MKNKTKKPLVINLIGGPGCGKSTAASGLFYALKKLQINAELSSEWVKSKVYEESFHCMDDQIYIFAKQHHKLFVLEDKVDVVVTDCSLLNSLVYGERDEDFDRFIIKLFKKFNNLNVLIRRKQEYVTDGRLETKEEAIAIDDKYMEIMDKYNIPYIELDNVDACDYIIKYLIENHLI
jgi:nicotinamide riboside kinase